MNAIYALLVFMFAICMLWSLIATVYQGSMTPQFPVVVSIGAWLGAIVAVVNIINIIVRW
jgi:hypothetical protein